MTEIKTPVFGVDRIKDLKPAKKPSKAEQERIARNATHYNKVDTSKPPAKISADPIRFPEPKITERDGRRFTTVGARAHLYKDPNGTEDRRLIGDLMDLAADAEYIKRLPHPELPDAMPSIELGFERSIKVKTPDGELVDFIGVAYGDRRGVIWDGMPLPEGSKK